MIKKVIAKHRMDNFSEIRQNLQYWLTKTPQQRLAAVDSLRNQLYGNVKIQKTVRVIRLNQKKTSQTSKLSTKTD